MYEMKKLKRMLMLIMKIAEAVCVMFCRLVGYPGHYRRLFGLRQEEVKKVTL